MDDDLMVREGSDTEDLLDLRLDGSIEPDDGLEFDRGGPSSPAPVGSSEDRAGRAERSSGKRSRWLWLLVVIAFPLGGLVGYGLRAGPPQMGLSLDLIDFGQQRVSAHADVSIIISSLGESDLEIIGLTLDGGRDGDFVIAEDRCGGRRIANGQSCEVTLRFAPSVPGSQRGRLLVTSNATEEPVATPVLGSGTAPELRAEPGQLDFLERKLGAASAPARFWLANIGTAKAEIEAVTIVGSASAEFVAMSDTCSGSVLDPSQRCALEIVFIAKRVGERRATIRVQSNAKAPAEATLLGRGLELSAGLRADTDQVTFGEIEVGDQGTTESVVLSSAGDGSLEVRQVGITGDSGFRVLAKNCGRLAPAERCRVDVRFQPVQEGEARATLEIHHNGAEAVTRVLLTGTGTSPRLELEPGRVAFGEVVIGTRSSARRVQAANRGSGVLAIANARIVGADAPVFRITRETCRSGQLRSASERCSIEIDFKPRRRGPHRAELIVAANGQQNSVAMNGFGIESRLEISPSRVELGEVELGGSARAGVTLENIGRAPLGIDRVSLRGPASSDFDVVADHCSSTVLPSARTCDFSIRFEPTRTGLKSVQIVIDHDGPDRQRTISVQATARQQRLPKARVEPSRLELAGQRVGALSPIETITLVNEGTGPLTIQSTRIVGPNAADFYIVSGSCEGLSRLSAGRRCTFGIRFEPAAIGSRRASLLIRHDAAGGSATISLTGEAF